MKTTRTFAVAFIAIFCAFTVSAQTADEIINKYLDASGGKDFLSKITSVYYEATMDVMGMQATVKNTTLNGKGTRQDVDIMGSLMTTCFSENSGWSTNPFMGTGTPEDMPEAQYNAGKDNIVVGAPFINYAEKGYKAELAGNDSIGDVSALILKMTSPSNNTSTYYFDPNSFQMLRSVEQADMQGQMVENVLKYSDYRNIDGYQMPYKIDMDMAGGQMLMTLTVSKVELNVPVNDSIFMKP
ncbi:MAG: hypothetical protein V1903_01310 [Bacteroidota bacterium]